MTFTAKFVLEEAPKSRRHIELFFGRVGLRPLVQVNVLLVTRVRQKPQLGANLAPKNQTVVVAVSNRPNRNQTTNHCGSPIGP